MIDDNRRLYYQSFVSTLEGAQNLFLLLQTGHSLLVVLETAQVEASDQGEMCQVLDMMHSACVWSVRRAMLTEGGAGCARLLKPVLCLQLSLQVLLLLSAGFSGLAQLTTQACMGIDGKASH